MREKSFLFLEKRGVVMTLEEFRIKHSALIEEYQFIEFNLKGIYASVFGEGFIQGLEEVEASNIGKLIIKINKIEAQNNISIIPNDLLVRIEQVRNKRNFWCHNCYVDMTFKPNGDPKKKEDMIKLMDDLREAEDLKDILQEIKLSLMRKNPPKPF